jgi:DNA-binding IclR family transcriptional regulator
VTTVSPREPVTPRGSAVPGTVQSVSRALRLLEFVAATREGVTAREVAQHLDLALPSTYHLLATLTQSRYVIHLADVHRYVLGNQVRLLERGLTRQLEAPEPVAAALRRLHTTADAAAYYAIYRDVDVVIAHVVDSELRPRVRDLHVGFDQAAHATAFGKVMLAGMEDTRRDAYLSRTGLRPCTQRTIVDRGELEAQLTHVREANLALEIGEFRDGLSCMASPVRSGSGSVIGSVAVSLPSADLARRRWELERTVRHGAMAVTRVVTALSRQAHRAAGG